MKEGFELRVERFGGNNFIASYNMIEDNSNGRESDYPGSLNSIRELNMEKHLGVRFTVIAKRLLGK